MAYYNTTNEEGIHLKNAWDKVRKQDLRILSLFKHHGKTMHLSPWDVQRQLKDNLPITSIRRAMNTLTKDKLLEKTDLKMKGPYGKPSYCWRLNIPL